MTKESEATIQNEETKKKGKTIDERVEAAKIRLQQLQALKQKKESREKAKLNKLERAKDTRRKILVGALVLTREAQGETSHPSSQILAQQLTRPDDRELFGLPALDAPSSGT